MKLSKLYCNQPTVFHPVTFTPGLNVVLAEIRLPENMGKDTHNLGKSTLGRLLDFCLLSNTRKDHFLLQHTEHFAAMIFFLEIMIADDSYLTLARSVAEPGKVSFYRHDSSNQDYAELTLSALPSGQMTLNKGKQYLDGLLDLTALENWSFRKGISYLLRSQNDFGDVFQLGKFKGAHSDWKPYLAHLLGFDSRLVSDFYLKDKQIEEAKQQETILRRELVDDNGYHNDVGRIDNILLLKTKEAEEKQRFLESLDFQMPDDEATTRLVEQLDAEIADLNNSRYYLRLNQEKIKSALRAEHIAFDSKQAEKLFSEVGVLFAGQLKTDFDRLLQFNREINAERKGYLVEELQEVEDNLRRVNKELTELNTQRRQLLSFLQNTDIFDKFKQLNQEIVNIRTDIEVLERQRKLLTKLSELAQHIKDLEDERDRLQGEVQKGLLAEGHNPDSLFSKIRLYFNEIVERVINRQALLTVKQNNTGNLDFKAEILDQKGKRTDADMGRSYRKLLCVAFDMAVARAYLDKKFPHFIYHDGIFETLDDRKKYNLLAVIREYADLGLQQIITMIDSDLPQGMRASDFFNPDEIVLVLHDEGEQGRLFKMKSW